MTDNGAWSASEMPKQKQFKQLGNNKYKWTSFIRPEGNFVNIKRHFSFIYSQTSIPPPPKYPVKYYDGNEENVSCERMICEKKNLPWR